MRAWQLPAGSTGFDKLYQDTLPDLTPGPGEVLLRPEAVGICGSDFHYFLGDQYRVEYPTGSGRQADLWQVAGELSRRLTHIFLRNPDGRRPVFGGADRKRVPRASP